MSVETTTLEIGTQVKHQDNTSGVVVPGLMDVCESGHAMVDFDNRDGIHSCAIGQLEDLGKIQVKFNPEKCPKCTFANHGSCRRYTPDRFGWLLSCGGKGETPKRIYPYCQDEFR